MVSWCVYMRYHGVCICLNHLVLLTLLHFSFLFFVRSLTGSESLRRLRAAILSKAPSLRGRRLLPRHTMRVPAVISRSQLVTAAGPYVTGYAALLAQRFVGVPPAADSAQEASSRVLQHTQRQRSSSPRANALPLDDSEQAEGV